MSSQVEQVDTTIEVVTPENIAFHYTVAGPFRRFPAYFLDLLVRAALFLTVVFIVGLALSIAQFPGLAVAGGFILWFLLDWFYGGAFETWFNGQTPGKWVLGIRVLSTNGQPINGIQAILRNFLRSVDMFPMVSLEAFGIPAAAYPVPTFMLALVLMALSPRFQRLGDMVSGTMVVIEQRHWLTGVARLEDARVPQLANLIPSDYPISRTLARTLAAYVERRRFFAAPRRREVARHVAEPLIRRFGFPPDTSHDLLLCALYYRAFIADRAAEPQVPASVAGSPFGAARQAPPAATDGSGATILTESLR
jgi:uncharacterized RDD family membrane protein YckC